MAKGDSSLFKRIQRRRTNTRARRRETQQLPWYRRWKNRLNCCRKVEREPEVEFTEVIEYKTTKEPVSESEPSVIQTERYSNLRDVASQTFSIDSAQEAIYIKDNSSEQSVGTETGALHVSDDPQNIEETRVESHSAQELGSSDETELFGKGSKLNFLAQEKDSSMLELIQNCSIEERKGGTSEGSLDANKENDIADERSELNKMDDHSVVINSVSESSIIDSKKDGVTNGSVELDTADNISEGCESNKSGGKTEKRGESDAESNHGDYIDSGKPCNILGENERECKNERNAPECLEKSTFESNEVTCNNTRDLCATHQPQTKGNKSAQEIQRQANVETKSKAGKSVPDISLVRPAQLERIDVKDNSVTISDTKCEVDKSVPDVDLPPLSESKGDNPRDTIFITKDTGSKKDGLTSEIEKVEKPILESQTTKDGIEDDPSKILTSEAKKFEQCIPDSQIAQDSIGDDPSNELKSEKEKIELCIPGSQIAQDVIEDDPSNKLKSDKEKIEQCIPDSQIAQDGIGDDPSNDLKSEKDKIGLCIPDSQIAQDDIKDDIFIRSRSEIGKTETIPDIQITQDGIQYDSSFELTTETEKFEQPIPESQTVKDEIEDVPSNTQREEMKATCNAPSGVEENKGVKPVKRIPCNKDWDVPFCRRTDINEGHPDWVIPSGPAKVGFFSSFGEQSLSLPFPKLQTET